MLDRIGGGARSRKAAAVSLALTVGIALLFVLHVGFGKTSYAFGEVVSVLFHHGGDEGARHILWNLRFPRALIAIAAGAMLGVAGAVLQTVLRNPLAEPGLVGASSGAVLLAVMWLSFAAKPLVDVVPLPVVALAGGIGATAIVFALNSSQSGNGARLALIGAVASSMMQSAASLALLHRQEGLSSIFLWLFGSLNGRGWASWATLWPWALLGLTAAIAYARRAELLQLGDDTAVGLGLAVRRSRLALLLIASALTAASVSVVGAIGFVGLIGPHIASRLVGRRPLSFFPVSGFIAAFLLLGSDWIAQNVTLRLGFPGMEHYASSLPVGGVTTLLGAPFFLYLLRKSFTRGAGDRA